jgi:hypothetical protein
MRRRAAISSFAAADLPQRNNDRQFASNIVRRRKLTYNLINRVSAGRIGREPASLGSR